MERRDLIKEEIEQFGRVLGMIIADFIGLKARGEVTQGIEISKKELKEELNIDIDKLIDLSNNELIKYFKDHKLTAEHIELIADYLFKITESYTSAGKQETKKYLEKVLYLYDMADVFSQTISFDRINKKSRAENALQ
ncbi:MAG: hypothetical protein JKX79_01075 [Labilibaculum sp.]|nr:hypothetical protein [Labilibaculum sp.]